VLKRIAESQALIDANKRLALVAMLTFFEQGGHGGPTSISYTAPHHERTNPFFWCLARCFLLRSWRTKWAST